MPALPARAFDKIVWKLDKTYFQTMNEDLDTTPLWLLGLLICRVFLMLLKPLIQALTKKTLNCWTDLGGY